VVVHCRADDPPLPTLRDSGADALSLDLASVSGRVWEGLAVAVESGTRLVAGVIDPTRPTVPTSAVVQSITRPWRSVGLTVEQLRWVDVSPVCGLAGVSPTLARQLTTRTVEVARALTEIAAQG
jgi:methionine synthase II (cobalamin-independent)